MVSDNHFILREDNAGIAALTLNDPSTINSLSADMMNALTASLDEIAHDNSVQVVILRTAGKHFSAGHNLKEMTSRRSDADGGLTYFTELFAKCSNMMMNIVHLPQPVIAEVSGIATAAGCQLVAACDLAVASEDSSFATSGVSIGLFCSTPMVALSRNVPRKLAMEMLLTGDFLPAQRAADIGLVNQVVPLEELSQASLHLASKIAGKSGSAIKVGKRAFYEQAQMSLADAYAYTGKVMAENMLTNDANAGIDAFVNKQEMPQWQHN